MEEETLLEFDLVNMSNISNWLKYLSCHKRHRKRGKDGDSNCTNCVNKQSPDNIKQIDQDESVKETLSLSTISHIPGVGDGGSASLGDWSAVHQLDGIDASKVNLLCDGNSNNTSSLLGVLNRVEFCDRLESIVVRLEKIAQAMIPEKTTGLIAFESLIANSLKNYIACSRKLGGNIQSQLLDFNWFAASLAGRTNINSCYLFNNVSPKI
ncbi:unnamed protein product [Schistosoma turkestanicum]|nr:unnamed protein product [Schistosoma turkestanicum]